MSRLHTALEGADVLSTQDAYAGYWPTYAGMWATNCDPWSGSTAVNGHLPWDMRQRIEGKPSFRRRRLVQ